MQGRRSVLSQTGSALLSGALLRPGRAFAAPSAPEFTGIDGWLNTAGPLTMAGLRGKVVLVEFCTYTCINWRRTLPYVNRWRSEYGPQGLQIIGVHTPEFGFERIRPNVESVIRELGVRFPLAQDNEFRTWRAWGNRAWPSFYLVDGDGRIRLAREGEGHAAELERAICGLLRLPPAGAEGHASDDADLSRIRTPEFYFGSLRPTPQDRAQSSRSGEAAYAIGQTFGSDSGGPKLNEYQLDGTWARGQEALILRSPRGRVRVRFSAAKLHLVAGAPESAPLRVSVDGGGERTIEVGLPTMYTLLDGGRYGEHVLDFECSTPGLALFSTTFG